MKLPNVISLTRLLLAPVFVFLFTRGTGWGDFGALVTAILFEITDLLDGEIARRTNQVSDLGKFLDPIADSVSRFTVFLCFLSVGYASVWVVAILFWRDSVVSGIRIMGATKGEIISARVSGKIKAWFQGTAIISILCFVVWPDLLGLGRENVPRLAEILTTIVAAFTFCSMVDYLWGNRRVIASLDR